MKSKSRLLRRSGVSVALVAERLDWRPTVVVQVGVGEHFEEVGVMQEAWPGVKFIGFEPHPAIFRQIRSQYAGLLFDVALGDRSTIATLWTSPRWKNYSTLHRPLDEEGWTQRQVRVATLDSYLHGGWLRLREEDRVLLWLDCEGSELAVLSGGLSTLKLCEVLNVELTAGPKHVGWCDTVETDALIRSCGFYCQWIHTQRGSIGQYDAIYVRRALFKPELCCRPDEIQRFRAREAKR